MSEAQYLKFREEGVRTEWIDGKVEIMSPVSADHAGLTMFIILLIGGFVAENELGKVWTEPFEVRLPEQRRRRAPDTFFVGNDRLHLIRKMEFNGAPDLVVKVISPDSQTRDRREKFLEYETARVREYWLADPLSRTFEIYSLEAGGKFEPLLVTEGKIQSAVLRGLYFRPEWVWQLKLPTPYGLIQEMSLLRKKGPSTRRRRSSDNQP